jgi:hypothetical protein
MERFIAGAEKVGDFGKHDLIIQLLKLNVELTPLAEAQLVKLNVELTPLAKAQFQKLDHNKDIISLYVRGEKPDTCYMQKVCCDGKDKWVMLCTKKQSEDK